ERRRRGAEGIDGDRGEGREFREVILPLDELVGDQDVAGAEGEVTPYDVLSGEHEPADQDPAAPRLIALLDAIAEVDGGLERNGVETDDRAMMTPARVELLDCALAFLSALDVPGITGLERNGGPDLALADRLCALDRDRSHDRARALVHGN